MFNLYDIEVVSMFWSFMKRNVILMLGIIVLWVVFLYPFFLGEVVYCCDNALITIPARQFFFSQIKEFRFPLWNPLLFAGMPYISDINLSPLYPGLIVEFLLNIVFSPFKTLTISVALHVLICFLGMTWSSFLLFKQRIAAFTAACVFTFSGTLFTYVNNMPMLQVYTLFPWVFGCIILYCFKPTILRYGLVVGVSSLQILSGHPQLVYLSWIFLVGYCLFLTNGSIITRIIRIVLIISGIVLASSIQILPFFELVFNSTRIQSDVLHANEGALSVSSLLRFFVPTLAGDVRNGTDWLWGGSVYGYVSSFGLLISGLYIFSFKNTNTTNKRFSKLRIYLVIGAAFSFIASFGIQGGLYSLLYTVLPGLAFFRVPAHFLLIFTICSSLLIGLTVGHIDIVQQRTKYIIVFSGLFLSCLVIALFGHTLLESLSANSMIPQYVLVKIASLKDDYIIQIGQATLLHLFVLCFAFFTIVFLRGRVLRMFILTIIIVELFIFSRRALVTIPELMIPADMFHPKGQLTTQRIYIHPDALPSQVQKKFGIAWLESEMNWQFKILRPNLSTLQQIGVINAYSSLVPVQLEHFFDQKSSDPTGISMKGDIISKLNQLSVSRVVLPVFNRCTVDCQQYSLLPIEERGLGYNLHSLSSLPFARYINNQYIRPLQLQVYQPGYMRLSVNDLDNGVVEIAEMNFPGWSTYVNDHKVKTNKSFFLETKVTPNITKIEFKYEPLSVLIGALISSMSVFLYLAVLIIRVKKSREIVHRKRLQVKHYYDHN